MLILPRISTAFYKAEHFAWYTNGRISADYMDLLSNLHEITLTETNMSSASTCSDQRCGVRCFSSKRAFALKSKAAVALLQFSLILCESEGREVEVRSQGALWSCPGFSTMDSTLVLHDRSHRNCTRLGGFDGVVATVGTTGHMTPQDHRYNRDKTKKNQVQIKFTGSRVGNRTNSLLIDEHAAHFLCLIFINQTTQNAELHMVNHCCISSLTVELVV